MGEKAGEDFELPEVPEGHQDYRYTLPVSLTISILAVLVAGATLLGHRAHTEELLLQSIAGHRSVVLLSGEEYSVS